VGVNYAGRHDAALAVCRDVEAAGARAVPLRADVSDPAQVRAMFDACEAALGPLRGLVNNAGILDRAAPFADHSPDRWRRLLAVNLEGTLSAPRKRCAAWARGAPS
jgi:3-oxoacyl-[acyl-carrier protein] reductase